MKHDRVSVIIPVYNEAQRLNRCLSSVTAQTHRELEIILVDDGSTDGSPGICKDYADKDSRIRVIRQENRGLAAARNCGLDAATADLIQFVDSDDWILPTMTEELLTALKTEGASAAQCGFYKVNEEEHFEIPAETETDECRVFRGKDIFDLLTKENIRTVVQWNKLFRREIFNGLRFPEGKVHEDEFIIHRELARMDSFLSLNKKLYVYTQRRGSITDQRTVKTHLYACEAYLDRMRFFTGIGNLSAAAYAYVRLFRQIETCKRQMDKEVIQKEDREKLISIRDAAKAVSDAEFPWVF